MKTRKFQVEVEETVRDNPCEGEMTYRLLSYSEEEMFCYEFYGAEYEVVDVGGPDYGPKLSLNVGDWKYLGSGLGRVSLEELVQRQQEDDEADENGLCRICGTILKEGVKFYCHSCS